MTCGKRGCRRFNSFILSIPRIGYNGIEYELNAPFRNPTHFINITSIEKEKRKLVRFHADQVDQENITLSLNAFRAAQLISKPDIRFAECFLKINPYEIAASIG